MARVNPEAVYDTRGGHIPALPKDRCGSKPFRLDKPPARVNDHGPEADR